jgi:iron complex outermembrane receptor protein
MRLSIVVAMCVAVISAAVADEARGAMRIDTRIPAQGLGTALRMLAKERSFQLVYVSEEVDELRTSGAVGKFTAEEALQQLLLGTGFTFRYLDEKTVTIVSAAGPAPDTTAAAAAVVPVAATTQTESGAIVEESEEPEPEEVTVVGSRGIARTDVDRPVPVDMVDARDLRTTGQTDLAQQIQFTSPSFSSAKYGVNGTTNYADPASLRGLSPDQVLVLVNGKRRHQFSSLNLNVAPGLGTVVTDLNSIPSSAIQRIEVLRDGAAAQYGSDAIAGIINLVLNDDTDGGVATSTGGVYKEGDGTTYKLSLNQGLALGSKGGFVNYAIELFGMDGTNRSDPYTGPIYPATPANYAVTGPTPAFPYATANPRQDRGVYPLSPFVVGRYGSNENHTYQLFANSQLPLSETSTLYAFGGYSSKEITAYGFFRAPASTANSALSIYPDGFVPILPGNSIDYSAAAGVKGEILGAWKYDLSANAGENYLDLRASNTVNPSLGAQSPVEFYIGRTTFRQGIGELNLSRFFGAVGPLDSLNVALGTQVRRDNFKVSRGSLESYQVGPLAFSGKAVGASGRPGIAPADENDLSRTNVGAYVDVESDLTKSLLLTTALRFENYSDFGSNLSGKLAARYKLNDTFAVRASYNRGFRAPSLAQLGNRVNTSTVQNNVIITTKQVSSDDPRLAQLGVPQPDAEISDNFNVGLTAEAGDVVGGRLLTTLDAFQIDIKDRIAITDRILTNAFPAVAALFPQTAEIRFFTNQIDTRTQGIDLVTTWRRKLDSGAALALSLAGTYSKTNVERQRPTPAPLLVGASAANQSFRLVDQTAIELIEVALPRTKVLLNSTFETGPLTINARASYFGNVKAFSTGLSAADSNVRCNAANRCVQTFAGKTLLDLSFSYAPTEAWNLTLGGNNIFDTYPDKYNNFGDGFVGQASSYSDGQIPYSRNSNQFGFNGAYYYLTATFSF